MTSLWSDHTIDAGCFFNAQAALLSLSTDSLTQEGVAHSRIVLYSVMNGAVREVAVCPWRAASMAVALQGEVKRGLALGEDGELLEISQSGTRDLSLARHAGGPTPRGPLRKVKSLAGHAVVVGMNRQVYAVGPDGKWQDMSPPAEAGLLGGFESLAGPSLDDFVCVGWRGEIWRCRQGDWTKLDSPTPLLITNITLLPDGSYMACGLDGLLLVGRGDQWRACDQTPVDQNLYGIAAHAGGVYATSVDSLYEVREERLCKVSDASIQDAQTVHSLQSIDANTLGVVGAKVLSLRIDDSWTHCN